MPLSGERHDDGRYAEQGDADAIDEADEGADGEHQRQRIDQRAIRALDHARQQNAAEPDGPGKRKVEAAGQDHRPLSQGEHGQERGQDDQRIVVVPVPDRVAERELRDQHDGEKTQIGRRREAQRFGVTLQEGGKRGAGARRIRRLIVSFRGSRVALTRQEPLPARAQSQNRAPGILNERRIAAEGAGEHREDQDSSLGDGRIIGRNVQLQQDVDHHHQDVGAENRAQRSPASPAQGRPADDDGREYLQQHRVADERIARARLRADERAGEAVTAAGDHIDDEFDEAGRNARRAGRVAIAADRVDRHAEARALQPYPKRQQHADQQNRLRQEVGNRVADQEIAQRGGERAAGLVHHQQRDSLQDEHRRQSDDDRLHAQDRDEKAVEGPRQRADADAGGQDEQRRRRGVLQPRGQGHVDERNHRAGREVETAGEYDDRLPHRRQGESGAAGRHRGQIIVAQRDRTEERHGREQRQRRRRWR